MSFIVGTLMSLNTVYSTASTPPAAAAAEFAVVSAFWGTISAVLSCVWGTANPLVESNDSNAQIDTDLISAMCV